MIPGESKRSAYQACSEDDGDEEGNVEEMNGIGDYPKTPSVEYTDVQSNDRGANEKHGGGPGDLANEEGLAELGQR